ncbi:MAG: pyruvoyl-dependent arginine decarboxylase [bacterium]
MNIILSSGKGQGKTLLSAFDCALFDAGVSNYNLLILSSIIPPGAVIRQQKYKTPNEEYGHRLYVVMSENRSRESGRFIGAAVGWSQEEDGRGVFVEHYSTENSEDAVRSLLEEEVKRSLTDLCRFRGFSFTQKKMNIKMCVTKVTDSPASVLVVAVYQAQSWDSLTSLEK